MLKRQGPVILLLTALLCLPMLSTACGDDDGGGGSSSLTPEEEEVLYYTNYARTDPQGFAQEFLLNAYNSGSDNGAYDDLMGRDPVGPLEAHSGLTTAARKHAKDMAENCGLQHDSCDGTSWSDRLRQYYDGGTLAENAAMGYPTGQSVVIGWIIDSGVPSLGHRHNLLNGSYEHIGIGYYSSYWVQDFGAGGSD